MLGRSLTAPQRAAPKPRKPAATGPVAAAPKAPTRSPLASAAPARPRDPPARQPDETIAQLRLRVVGVHDGDTLTGLDDAKTQHKIRLHAIDAPELGQPYGQVAKRALSDKVFGQDVVVVPQTIDKYGRTIGQVSIDGRDVNLELLEEGMAWHYEHYDDDERRRQAAAEARDGGKGLWQDRSPVPPWEWRKQERSRRGGG